jgi:hypothetical protein
MSYNNKGIISHKHYITQTLQRQNKLETLKKNLLEEHIFAVLVGTFSALPAAGQNMITRVAHFL